MTGLCERLRAKYDRVPNTGEHIINPDGPEAADRIESLEAALERAVDALDGFKVSPVGGTAKMRALLSGSPQ